MRVRDALAEQKAKAIAPGLPETAQINELFQSIEVVLVRHKGPAIERLKAAYEALEGGK